MVHWWPMVNWSYGEAWSDAKLRTLAICHDDLRPRAFWNDSSDSQQLNSVSLAFPHCGWTILSMKPIRFEPTVAQLLLQPLHSILDGQKNWMKKIRDESGGDSERRSLAKNSDLAPRRWPMALAMWQHRICKSSPVCGNALVGSPIWRPSNVISRSCTDLQIWYCNLCILCQTEFIGIWMGNHRHPYSNMLVFSRSLSPSYRSPHQVGLVRWRSCGCCKQVCRWDPGGWMLDVWRCLERFAAEQRCVLCVFWLLQIEVTLVTFGAAMAACGKRWQMALCLREDMSQAWLEVEYMTINETNILRDKAFSDH